MAQFWVSDENATNCYSCSSEFSITLSKHHCRKCGQVYCNSCSRYKGLIPRDEAVQRPISTSGPASYLTSFIVSEDDILTAPQRLCFLCHEAVKDRQEELKLLMSPSHQKTIESGTIMSAPAIHFRLEDEIEKAMALLTVSQGKHDPSNFESCYGLVFLTVVKAGLIFTGKYGTGFVVARLNDMSWSAPSAITVAGMGWGFQVGAEVQHVCFILPNMATVTAFKSSGQFSLGGEVSLAFIMGMSVEADISAGKKGVAYGHGLGVTQGLFFGTSIEATFFGARRDVNRAFYGQDVTPSQLLGGTIPRPPAANSLSKLIDEFLVS